MECVTQKRGLFPRPVELSVCKEGGPAPFGCAGGVQGTGNGFTGEKWDAHPSAQHVQAHVAPDPSPNLSCAPTSRHLIQAEAGRRMANTAKPPRGEAGTGSQQKPGFVSLMGSAPVPAGKGKVRGHRCAGREMGEITQGMAGGELNGLFLSPPLSPSPSPRFYSGSGGLLANYPS